VKPSNPRLSGEQVTTPFPRPYLRERHRKALEPLFTKLRTSEVNNNCQMAQLLRQRSVLKSSAFFYEALAREPKPAGSSIGYFCHLVPEEIIIAAGFHPQRLCATDSYQARSGEELVSVEACPVVKSIAGLARNDFFRSLPLVVLPGSCDGKTRLAELLSVTTEVYFLDVGRGADYLENASFWAEKYRQFLHFLRKRFGITASREKMLQACHATNRRTEAFRRLYRYRAENPGAISAFDYFAAASASFFCDPVTWTDQVHRLLEESQATAIKNTGWPRLLLAGSPILFPAFKLLEVLEEAHLEVAADLTCGAYGHLFDPVEIDEETEDGLLRALALKYIGGSLCPCFPNLGKLADRIQDAVSEYRLDGVVYYVLRLCQVYDLQTITLRQILKDGKVPLLAIKTDLEREDRGQLITRLEALREMLGEKGERFKR